MVSFGSSLEKRTNSKQTAKNQPTLLHFSPCLYKSLPLSETYKSLPWSRACRSSLRPFFVHCPFTSTLWEEPWLVFIRPSWKCFSVHLSVREHLSFLGEDHGLMRTIWLETNRTFEDSYLYYKTSGFIFSLKGPVPKLVWILGPTQQSPFCITYDLFSSLDLNIFFSHQLISFIYQRKKKYHVKHQWTQKLTILGPMMFDSVQWFLKPTDMAPKSQKQSTNSVALLYQILLLMSISIFMLNPGSSGLRPWSSF